MVIEPEGGKMSYYVKDDKKTKQGEILLKTIKAVKVLPGYKGRQFVFGVVTTTGRTFYIQCADDSGVESWMVAISAAANLDGPQSPQPHVAPPPTPTAKPPQITPEKVNYDSFEILRVIGRGGFGRVLLVRKRDTRKV